MMVLQVISNFKKYSNAIWSGLHHLHPRRKITPALVCCQSRRNCRVKVNSFRTIVGVKCKDGVILGAEKQILSNLLVERTNRRIFNVDHAIGMAISGKIPDGRHLMTYGRNEATKFLKDFSLPISGRTLADRIGLYLNAYTLYNSVRPFGSV